MMLCVAIWTAGGAMELVYLDLPSNITWSKIAYLGIVNIVPFFIVFVLEYTGRERWLTRRTLIALWAIPVLALVLVATNEWHNLIWSSVVANPDPFNPIPIYYHGAGYWIFLFYTYAILFLASSMLIWSALRLPRSHQAQLIAILVGVPLPWLANILYVTGLSPVQAWDLAPIAFGLAGFSLTLGIYRYRLLDLVPLARDKVYESLRDGLVVLDTRARIVDINPAAGAMIGKTAEQVSGRPFGEIFPGLLELLGRGGVTEMPMSPERTVWMEVQVSELHNTRQVVTGQLVALHDISERKAAEVALEAKSRELARLAVTDVLTNLYNRRYAEDALRAEFSRAIRYHVPLSLAMFDIDLFKQINDRCGHAVGDEVLREVAARLRETMRGSDIVARVGGDEFLVILANTGLQDAWLAVERFRTRLSEADFAPIGEAITISGGVTAWFPGDEPDEALRRADRLLYSAKGAGRRTILKDELPAPQPPPPAE
jgi:diguanylate cyclase (GGDEF)-like protein/PAS domain S-box-containing protein